MYAGIYRKALITASVQLMPDSVQHERVGEGFPPCRPKVFARIV